MTIKKYFQTVDSIAKKTKEIDVLKKQLSNSRRNIDLDEATRLRTYCFVTFQTGEPQTRLSFVFLFVLIYGMSPDMKIPHTIRYILSLILKVDGTSISRDWRMAKQMMNEDDDFAKKVESIYDNFIEEITYSTT